MAKYRVVVKHEDGEEMAEQTSQRQDALDWFLAATEAVLHKGQDATAAILEVDGEVWGIVREPIKAAT